MKRQETPQIHFSDYFCSKCSSNSANPIVSKKVEFFELHKNYFDEVLNVFNYYGLYQEFNNLKKVVLDDKEEACFNMVKHDLHHFEKIHLEKSNCFDSNFNNSSNKFENPGSLEKSFKEEKQMRIFNLLDVQAKNYVLAK